MYIDNIKFTNNNKSNILNILFLINILTPYSSWAYYVQIFSLLLAILFLKGEFISIDAKTFFIIFAIIISFFFAFFWSKISIDNYFRFFNLFLLFIFFPISKNYSIKPNLLLFILVIIFASQLVYFFNITPIIDTIEKIYTLDPHQNALGHGALNELSAKYAFRTGGIYHNPNNCGEYLTLIMVIYILETINVKNYRNYLFYFLMAGSIILTGSRTTAIVILLIIFYYFLSFKRSNKKLVFYLIIITLTLLIISNNLRIFNLKYDVNNKSDGSLIIKFEIIRNYILHTNLISLIWGNFNINALGNIGLFKTNGMLFQDNEIGSIIQALGLFGLIALIIFYYNIFKKGNKFSNLVLILILWSFSNSIFFQFKFSFLYMLILSNYFQFDFRALLISPQIKELNSYQNI